MQVAVPFPTAPSSPHYQNRQFSPLPIASSSIQTSKPSSGPLASMQDSHMSSGAPVLPAESADPMYADLPTYRFPAGPSRSGSAPATNNSASGSRLFGLTNKPALPVAPPPEQLYDDGHCSPTVSPAPSLQTSSSTLSSIASQSLLKPALPIITFPNAPLPEYEVENVYPSGMVSHAGSSYHPPTQGLGYHASPVVSDDNGQWMSLSPMKLAPSPQPSTPQTPNRFTDYGHSHRFDLEFSPANLSPSTYLPSSAYLPSSGTFTGPPLSTANIPRSAPSTPLGRQDARFMGKAGWPSQGLPNPFPLNVPQTEPRMRTDFGLPQQSYYAQHPALGNSTSGYYSADEYERETSPMYISVDSNRSMGNADSRYIPYARPMKGPTIQAKRSPPRMLEISTSSKKLKTTIEGSYPGSQSLSYSSESTLTDSKPKQQRCKIACAACRKTRLKCESDR